MIARRTCINGFVPYAYDLDEENLEGIDLEVYLFNHSETKPGCPICGKDLFASKTQRAIVKYPRQYLHVRSQWEDAVEFWCPTHESFHYEEIVSEDGGQ